MKCKLCGGDVYDGICENITDNAHIMSLLKLIKYQDKLLVAYRLRKRPSDEVLDTIATLKEELGL